MSQQKEDMKPLVKQLESALADESKRKYVEEILDNFSKFERHVLIEKVSTIIRYLREVAGDVGANILMEIVGRVPPDVDETLALFESIPVRDWARALNRNYVATYEGTFPPFQDDWYRIHWSISMNTTYGMPFIGTRITKRNGDVVYLDQPFAAALKLMGHQLRQMKGFKDQGRAAFGEDIQKELNEIQRLVTSLLTDQQAP